MKSSRKVIMALVAIVVVALIVLAIVYGTAREIQTN